MMTPKITFVGREDDFAIYNAGKKVFLDAKDRGFYPEFDTFEDYCLNKERLSVTLKGCEEYGESLKKNSACSQWRPIEDLAKPLTDEEYNYLVAMDKARDEEARFSDKPYTDENGNEIDAFDMALQGAKAYYLCEDQQEI